MLTIPDDLANRIHDSAIKTGRTDILCFCVILAENQ